MRYRILGRTGLQVSEISLGTVQFGLPYGIPDRNGKLPELTESQSIEIIRQACEDGVNFMDTARDYGKSEAVIRQALKTLKNDEIYIATKLKPLNENMSDDELGKTVIASIESSRRTLERETIDILQLHNATENLMKRTALLDILCMAKEREWIRFAGVTTYGLDAPLYAIKDGFWDTVQVEFNLFNQKTSGIFNEAAKNNIGIIVRSAMLKGAMALAEDETPVNLQTLHKQAKELPAFFKRSNLSIPQIALLFVLSHSQISTVLTGVVSKDQLIENILTEQAFPFSKDELISASALNMDNTDLTDPRRWNFNISPVL